MRTARTKILSPTPRPRWMRREVGPRSTNGVLRARPTAVRTALSVARRQPTRRRLGDLIATLASPCARSPTESEPKEKTRQEGPSREVTVRQLPLLGADVVAPRRTCRRPTAPHAGFVRARAPGRLGSRACRRSAASRLGLCVQDSARRASSRLGLSWNSPRDLRQGIEESRPGIAGRRIGHLARRHPGERAPILAISSLTLGVVPQKRVRVPFAVKRRHTQRDSHAGRQHALFHPSSRSCKGRVQAISSTRCMRVTARTTDIPAMRVTQARHILGKPLNFTSSCARDTANHACGSFARVQRGTLSVALSNRRIAGTRGMPELPAPEGPWQPAKPRPGGGVPPR